MTEDRIELLRAGYEAFNRGDHEWLLVRAAPDFVAQDRPEIPDPQVHHGREGAARAMDAARAEFDEYCVEPREVIEVGDHVVVVAQQSGRGRTSGVTVEGDIVHVWGYRGGEIISLRAFSSREEALAAAQAGV